MSKAVGRGAGQGASRNRPRPSSEELAGKVYAIVRLVPPGTIVSYGDIAGMLDLNPRQVGRFMAISDSLQRPGEAELPWWRITNAAGRLPDRLTPAARTRWHAEGLVTAGADRVSIRGRRADLAGLAQAAEQLLGPLPGVSGTVGERARNDDRPTPAHPPK